MKLQLRMGSRFMFSYYGAKTKIVKYYPKPKFDRIIEPFAGSARYALEYADREVILYETYEKAFKVWQYLISATETDILSLPDLKLGDDIRKFTMLSDAERWLIGYQLQRGCARPGCIVNDRCRWNTDKVRISKEVAKVKHWKIINQSGFSCDWVNATLFIDPPYTVQKHGYTHGSVDYAEIARRIHCNSGQYIVCGNTDDKWLDFKPLVQMRGIAKKHMECMWHRYTGDNTE